MRRSHETRQIPSKIAAFVTDSPLSHCYVSTVKRIFRVLSILSSLLWTEQDHFGPSIPALFANFSCTPRAFVKRIGVADKEGWQTGIHADEEERGASEEQASRVAFDIAFHARADRLRSCWRLGDSVCHALVEHARRRRRGPTQSTADSASPSPASSWIIVQQVHSLDVATYSMRSRASCLFPGVSVPDGRTERIRREALGGKDDICTEVGRQARRVVIDWQTTTSLRRRRNSIAVSLSRALAHYHHSIINKENSTELHYKIASSLKLR